MSIYIPCQMKATVILLTKIIVINTLIVSLEDADY